MVTFIHFSLQEFLAAYHISCLPHYEKFCVFKEKFMSDFYTNTFTMYVGITRGEESAFKQYLSGCDKWTAFMYGLFGKYAKYYPFRIDPPSIATYPFDVRCYLRLFKCFYEADNEKSCKEITDAIFYFFCGYVLISEILPPSDVDCLGLFLCSRKEWKGLYFHQFIDDVGFQILHQLLTNRTKSPYIHTIRIGSNLMCHSADGNLTQSSSFLITEIARSCKTRVLEVFLPVLLLKDVITLKNQLTQLIFYVDKSQTGIQAFMPIYLHDDKILEVLDSYEKQLSKDSVECFAQALKQNNVNECSLAQVLWMKLYRLLTRILQGIIARLLHFIYICKGLLILICKGLLGLVASYIGYKILRLHYDHD